jgi:three-Cys-motif partner protein
VSENFFEEQSEQSQIKAAIVSNYFWSWAKVITGFQKSGKKEQKIAYIDLFAGRGRYGDGKKSTPLLILEHAIADDTFRKSLVTMFNDGADENVSILNRQIDALDGIGTLTHKPGVYCNQVGDEIVKTFDAWKRIPTLMFVDPWGYKGLSLRLINSVLKNWACECIFFFNYNRINMGLSNPVVKAHMEALFGEERATKLRKRLEDMDPANRELTIVEELAQALKEMGGKYVLPFCFKNKDGTRTTHHLVFVSKHPLGYKIMKRVMAEESSTTEQGVASFAYNPAEKTDRERQPLLFELSRPLDELEGMLLDIFAGKTLTMVEIYDQHNVDRPYTDSNYKQVLRKMELAGTITAQPPHTARPKRKGEVTFADTVRVTFPQKPKR